MRRFISVLFALFLLGWMSLPASAQEEVIPEPWPCCGVWTDPAWLHIDYQRVNVEIVNQIASTNVDMQFTNEGSALAEGTFIFPLPEEAAVDQLIMYIDGVPIEARILPADEARAIYDEIVRQYRDPALLEYIGTNAIQANVFPIPPGESRRVEFTYSQVLAADNGLVKYIYPMNSNTLSSRSIGQMNVSVTVESADPISTIYSPSHDIAVFRDEDAHGFRAGWEDVDFFSPEDFTLYYGIANEEISVNLLSFKESATEDGFFMLLVQPPVIVPDDQIIPKDVVIVLDQSGSMSGEKWNQAVEAVKYVLANLKEQDRFNIVSFSTGVRVYSREMVAASDYREAVDWVDGLFPEGGTNINEALLTALDMSDTERATTVLFLTDGLATEGVVNTQDILDNLEGADRPDARIFTFGVGDDVDTFLLDQVVDAFNGTGAYVRPDERIEEEVASLYNKINAPVLQDAEIDFGDAFVELTYPDALNDLFAGEQVTLVGRYREGADNLTLTLTGTVNGETQTYTYGDLSLRDRAGGEPFIARLWATRRIGELLNTIRLNGENRELVDSIVNLSVRYGIITPYTSFLIEESDILTQTGRDSAAAGLEDESRALADDFTGAGAVDAAEELAQMQSSEAPASVMAQPTATFGTANSADGGGVPGGAADGEGSSDRRQNALTAVNDKTFILLDGVWTDTTFDPETMETEKVEFLSDAYFDLLTEHPELGDYFALGARVIVVVDEVAYEVTDAAE